MEINEKQLKRIFYLGDEYGPDFIGLYSTSFEMDMGRLIVTIRVLIYDEGLTFDPVGLNVRRIVINEDGEIFEETSKEEPYVEEVMGE